MHPTHNFNLFELHLLVPNRNVQNAYTPHCLESHEITTIAPMTYILNSLSYKACGGPDKMCPIWNAFEINTKHFCRTQCISIEHILSVLRSSQGCCCHLSDVFMIHETFHVVASPLLFQTSSYSLLLIK